MVSSSLATVLTLATLTLAVPHSNRHFGFHNKVFGSDVAHPSGRPRPSGGLPFNGTTDGPFGNGTEASSGSIPVITATVVPVPEESPVADATKPVDAPPADFSGPEDVNQGNADTPVADATAPTAGGAQEQCVIVTTTATSIQYVTITAGAAEEEKVAISTPAGFEAPESTATIVSDTPAVSAGAFFGAPPGGNTYGGGFGGQSSSAAAAPTPVASEEASAPAVPSTVPSTTPSTGGSSGGKKGLSYNAASLLAPFAGTGMSWAYNWADSPGGTLPDGIEFVPMCWSADSGPTFASKAAGASHVLSFNEPDHGEQATMDPATAAENHIKYLNPIAAQVGSPAITNGAGTNPLMGIDWLNAFFKACGGQCKLDFVAFHWYDSNKNIEYFKKHVNDVIKVAADQGISKVWLTEYGTTDGDSPEFIKESMAFLEETAAVEKYAYFMVDNILTNGNGLSAAGQAYTE